MQSENISIPMYVECDKMYQSKVCVPEFSYFVSGLDIQLEKSEYDSPVPKKIGWRSVFFKQWIRTNGSVAKVSRREQGDLGSIPEEC